MSKLASFAPGSSAGRRSTPTPSRTRCPGAPPTGGPRSAPSPMPRRMRSCSSTRSSPPSVRELQEELDALVRTHGRRVAILTTLKFHRRSRDDLAARYQASTSRARATLPAGVGTLPIRGAGETMVWLPEAAGADPRRPPARRRRRRPTPPRRALAALPPERNAPEGPRGRPSGRSLDLPVELVLVSHGAPVPRTAAPAIKPARSSAVGTSSALPASSSSGSGTGEPSCVSSGSCGVRAQYSLSPCRSSFPTAPSSSSRMARPASTPRARSARSSPSRLSLVRANGSVRDLRLPLADGEQIQILTTRDREDPDALYVLRHSAAHLLAEAARRLYPGTKVAIGPPIENGFYYDFEFPEPVTEEALERLEEEMRREIAEGRESSSAASRAGTRRGATSRRRASPTRSSWSTRPRATSPSTSRATSSTSAAARTSRTPRRSRR